MTQNCLVCRVRFAAVVKKFEKSRSWDAFRGQERIWPLDACLRSCFLTDWHSWPPQLRLRPPSNNLFLDPCSSFFINRTVLVCDNCCKLIFITRTFISFICIWLLWGNMCQLLINFWSLSTGLGGHSENLLKIFLSFFLKSTLKDLKYTRWISWRHAFDSRVTARISRWQMNLGKLLS